MINIKINNKKYNFNTIIKDIDIQLKKGKIYGLIGKNGSGKTTLFKCISDLENFDGKIETSINNLKKKTGILWNEPYILDNITGKEYVNFMCQIKNIKNTNIEENNIFNLPLDKYMMNYSSGMKKKLILFSILMQKNEFIILDEPFNGIDVESNILINIIIKKLKNLNTIVFMSSNIIESLTNICDEIFIIENKTISSHLLKNEFENIYNNINILNINNIDLNWLN